jgi:hypothetical protein
MKEIYWGFKVKTDSYAGNFEREMCAYMTGQLGECGVGDEFVDMNISNLFSNIKDLPDDHGCYRPVALDNSNSDNFIIFFESEPTDEQIKIMSERSHNFSEVRKNVGSLSEFYKDKNIKVLGFDLIMFDKDGILIQKL